MTVGPDWASKVGNLHWASTPQKLLESGQMMKGWPSIGGLGWPAHSSALKSMEEIKDLFGWFFSAEHRENLKLCNLELGAFICSLCSIVPLYNVQLTLGFISLVDFLDGDLSEMVSMPLIVHADGTSALTVGDVPNWQTIVRKHLLTDSQHTSQAVARKRKRQDTAPSVQHKKKIIKALGRLDQSDNQRRHTSKSAANSAAPIKAIQLVESDTDDLVSEDEAVMDVDSSSHVKRAQTAPSTLFIDTNSIAASPADEHRPSGGYDSFGHHPTNSRHKPQGKVSEIVQHI